MKFTVTSYESISISIDLKVLHIHVQRAKWRDSKILYIQSVCAKTFIYMYIMSQTFCSIPYLLSQYDLNNVERDVKHQRIIAYANKKYVHSTFM